MYVTGPTVADSPGDSASITLRTSALACGDEACCAVTPPRVSWVDVFGGIPLSMPVRYGMRPVSTAARDGEHSAAAAWTSVNRIPSFARGSSAAADTAEVSSAAARSTTRVVMSEQPQAGTRRPGAGALIVCIVVM